MAFSQDVLEQITAYRPKLVGFMRRKGKRPEDAEDIAQETILRALSTQDEIRHVPAFLGKIALNIACTERRSSIVCETGEHRHSAFKDSTTYDHFFNSIESERTNQFTVLQVKELREHVAKLKPVFQRDFQLRCIEGHSFVEMARITGETELAHKARFHRMRDKLINRMTSSAENPAPPPPRKSKLKALAAIAGGRCKSG